MSKIGRSPVSIKEGITVAINGNVVNVKGTKGELSYALPKGIVVTQADGELLVKPEADNPEMNAKWGLARAQIANLVKGVDQGFEKKLELQGVGYRAQMQGEDLVLNLGFSHPVKFSPRGGVKISIAENIITIAGPDKMFVGQAAAKIRDIKPPEPYKGKGIRYVGEQVRRKAGKAAKAVGTK
ncbi:MAG TPA: 50S ribosomal protein L6 [Patescibacteria group bacterium]|nr:50S ribosomal protein L6 [Patescibacteria group bacterium]